MPKKTCSVCGGEFQPDRMTGPRCKPCASARAHSRRLEETYSITAEQYAQILAAQGGACYICRRKPGLKRLACDHDHSCCPGPVSCGKCVRGLLCRSCNRDVLGHLKDDVAALRRAIEYLTTPPARKVLK
ncbi:MAG TPA: endonuclease VII domain-containing protein [Pedococcus sp.]|nr:endonuclease VII domain-containing protein [Pedococcus sp.]